MTHICVGKLSIIGSDNGLSPRRRQAIIRTNAGILLIGPLGTNFSKILIEIQIFSIKEMQLKMSSAKWCPFCLGLNELKWAFVEVISLLPKKNKTLTWADVMAKVTNAHMPHKIWVDIDKHEKFNSFRPSDAYMRQ